jgi:DNA polymerase
MRVGDANVPEYDLESLVSALEWQIAMGAEDAVLDRPGDRYAEAAARKAARGAARPAPTAVSASSSPSHAPAPSPGAAPPPPATRPAADSSAPLGTSEAQAQGRQIAQGCETLEALRTALEAFDGCALRHTATQIVFADGNPDADVMIVGEAPGADEDRQGKPFVGVSGQLLDRMLASIGLDRRAVYIANTVYWRPPGNRKPNDGEFAVCRPFVERQIELAAPKLLLLVGDKAVRGLAGATDGITRSRGKWYEVTAGTRTIPALASFHPAYLLRTPAAKRMAWRDLLALQRRMREMGLGTG